MKIIVSHDVDHLAWPEHIFDTYPYGLFIRSLRGVGKRGITFKHFLSRFANKRLTRAVELCQFNQMKGITSTFFFGMTKGLNLSYSWKDAGKVITELHRMGADIGLHGMQYDSMEGLRTEQERIRSFLPEGYKLGIRNHYLRRSERTLPIMNDLGFAYDSTHYSLERPFRCGQLWEMPISFMDAGIINHGKNDTNFIKAITLEKLKAAQDLQLPFFVVNFHDLFFDTAFPFHYDWYQWLIDHLQGEGHQFCTFLQAVNELDKTVTINEVQ